MKPRLSHVCVLALAAGAACSHVEGVRPPVAPPPAGVPQQELAILEREYSINSKQCNRSAEEVVEIQHQCSKDRWIECVYAGAMYHRGCGVAKDPVQAEALLQRACDLGSVVGCSMVGVVTKDLEKGIALLEGACARGYSPACANLGSSLLDRGKEADVARATELLDEACRENNIYFCGALGKIVIKWKIEPRFATTRALLEHACKENDMVSCYMLGLALEDGSLGTVDYDRAAAVNWGACHEFDFLPSCNSLGYMLVRGRGYEKDPMKGAMLFYVGCNRGYGPSCESLGEATEKGWAGPANPSKALLYYDRACDIGAKDACKRAKELRATGSAAVEPPPN